LFVEASRQSAQRYPDSGRNRSRIDDETISKRAPANRSLRVRGLSRGRFIVQLVGVFGGLCRGVGFHFADRDVLTDEQKEH
jgi:hypothetical protein